jgi:hypothetical protein
MSLIHDCSYVKIYYDDYCLLHTQTPGGVECSLKISFEVCNELCIKAYDPNVSAIWDPLGSHKQEMPLIHDCPYIKTYYDEY